MAQDAGQGVVEIKRDGANELQGAVEFLFLRQRGVHDRAIFGHGSLSRIARRVCGRGFGQSGMCVEFGHLLGLNVSFAGNLAQSISEF